MQGVLPHPTCMSGGSSTIHYMLEELFKPSCISSKCEIVDMDNCMLDINVHDWNELAETLEKLRGGQDDITDAWFDTSLNISASDYCIMIGTESKIKVTHFGSVRISFIWKKKKGGHCRWTKKNTKIIVIMIRMIMRMLELCT